MVIEELQLYRNTDEEPREMAKNGLYEEEVALGEKVGAMGHHLDG